MRKTRIMIFSIFILIYAAGLFAGAVREINAPEQAELYEYLGSSVTEYSTSIKDGIKSVATDNLKVLILMLLGALSKPLCWTMAVAMGIKGYFMGFSMMAALRLYGIKGLLLCGANLLSSGIVVSAMAYFASIVIDEMIVKRTEKSEYGRIIAIAIFFLVTIFCIDCLAKGLLTSIFMKWSSKLIKI